MSLADQLAALVSQRNEVADKAVMLGAILPENPTLKQIADALDALVMVYVPAYAAVYGGDTLVFGRGVNAPESYNGKSLTESWTKAGGYDIETDIYYIEPGDEGANRPWRGYQSQITSVDVIDEISPVSTAYWFDNLYCCEKINLSKLDTSRITTGGMAQMFMGCSSITTAGTSEDCDLVLPEGFGSHVTTGSMERMLMYCESLTSLTLPEGFGSQMTTGSMENMFYGCSNLTSLDISSMNSAQVANMDGMFYECSSLTEVKLGQNWSFTGDGSTSCELPGDCWKGPNGTNYTPADLTANYDGSTMAGTYTEIEPPAYAMVYDTGETFTYEKLVSYYPVEYETVTVSAYELVFQKGNTPDPNKNLIASYTDFVDKSYSSYYPTAPWRAYSTNIRYVTVKDEIKPTNTSYWFYELKYCASMDLSKLNTSQTTNMDYMFAFCSSLTNLEVSGFETTKVNSMQYMFYGCESLPSIENIANWDTSNVTNMDYMFAACRGLTSLNLSGWDTSNVSSMGAMFYECKALSSLNVSKFKTGKVQSMSSMFSLCSALKSLDLSSWDTSSCTSMYAMFGSSGFTSLNLSGWDTSNVSTMYHMFYGCSSLTSVGPSTSYAVNVSGWNTNNVTNMEGMFSHGYVNGTRLTTLDLSGFNTTSVTDMDEMFSNNSGLTTIYVSNLWSTAAATSSTGMFYNCKNLKGDVAFDSSYTDKTYAKTSGGYLTYKAPPA